jgi:predicted TIM-barrel fold metal-dependent hydrolase
MQRFWDKLSGWSWAISVDIPRRVPDKVLEHILGDLEEVVQQYPQLNFIQEHFCFPSFPCTEKRMALLRYPNVFTEIGCASHGIFILEDSTMPSAQEHLRRMIDEYDGENKLLFGTDYPYVLNHATYWQVLDWIFRQCKFLNDSQRQKILGLNAVRCHHLEGMYERVQARKKQLKAEMESYYDPYL